MRAQMRIQQVLCVSIFYAPGVAQAAGGSGGDCGRNLIHGAASLASDGGGAGASGEERGREGRDSQQGVTGDAHRAGGGECGESPPGGKNPRSYAPPQQGYGCVRNARAPRAPRAEGRTRVGVAHGRGMNMHRVVNMCVCARPHVVHACRARLSGRRLGTVECEGGAPRVCALGAPHRGYPLECKAVTLQPPPRPPRGVAYPASVAAASPRAPHLRGAGGAPQPRRALARPPRVRGVRLRGGEQRVNEALQRLPRLRASGRAHQPPRGRRATQGGTRPRRHQLLCSRTHPRGRAPRRGRRAAPRAPAPSRQTARG